MGWVFLAVAIIAIAFVSWDIFLRGKRGTALAWSVTSMLTFSVAGIAQGAEAPGPWPLIGFLVGGVLFVVSERHTDTSRRSRSS